MEWLFYILLTICITALAFYVNMVIGFINAWKRLKYFNAESDKQIYQTKVAVIVAVRNEADNIFQLLNCLFRQDYPSELFQIIIVDDHSEDNTTALVLDFARANNLSNLKCIELGKQTVDLNGKKAAIAQGIALSESELIVTTDADCIVPETWLSTIVAYYQHYRPEMIVAPVMLTGQLLFQRIQQIEFISLMVATGASIYKNKPLMCNGANLAYTRKAYEAAGGFNTNRHIASGDDTFLMFEIERNYPGKVHYLKSTKVIVKTPAQKAIIHFFQQRKRWASKTKYYKVKQVSDTGFLVILVNMLLLLILLLAFGSTYALYTLLLMFISKLLVDAILLFQAFPFFKPVFNFKAIYIIGTAVLYPFYILILALSMANPTFNWKGRRISLKN